ncbi:16384_t:CDS:2, partial [Dentiscutata heterogama]
DSEHEEREISVLLENYDRPLSYPLKLQNIGILTQPRTKLCQNYIRNPCDILNIPVNSKEHTNKKTNYKKINDHKMSNEDIILDDNELLRGKEINYKSFFDDRIMNEEEMPVDYSNEVSSDEKSDFLDNKILDDEEILVDYNSKISNEESDLFDKDILDNNEIPIDYNNEVPKEESDKVLIKH